jgi:hypothetical protein
MGGDLGRGVRPAYEGCGVGDPGKDEFVRRCLIDWTWQEDSVPYEADNVEYQVRVVDIEVVCAKERVGHVEDAYRGSHLGQ